jgi:hypothetical protein
MNIILLNLVRELNFTDGDKPRTGKLLIHQLIFSEERKKWECHWSLDYLYPEAVAFTGDDPLQALTRTLDFAASYIRGCELDGSKLHWQYEGDHGGLVFPMNEEKSWMKND